jgi:WD40 repeat protein
LLKEFRVGQKSRLSGCFSPDSKLFAAASDDGIVGSNDGAVVIWDVATGKEIKRFVGGGGSVAFSPDGHLLASGGGKMQAAGLGSIRQSGRLRVWDWAREKVVLDKTGKCFPPRALVFSPDGRMIASSGHDPHISVWDLGRNEERPLIHDWPDYTGPNYPGSSGRHPLAFVGNGQVLASGGGDGTIRLWDVTSGKENKSKRMTVSGDPTWSLACARDGSTLAVGSTNGVCRIWDVNQGKEKLVFDEHQQGIRAAISKNGAWIATGSVDGTIRLWKARSGEFIRQWPAHEKSVYFLCSGPGERLACGATDGTVRLWDIQSGKELGCLMAPTKGQNSPWIIGLQYSGDGRQLLVGRAASGATGANSAEITIWDWQAAKEVHHPLSSGAMAVAATPDFKQVVASTDRAISLHNAATGALVFFKEEQAPAHMLDDQVIPFALSPDGAAIAAACHDQSIRIWDLRSRTERCQLVGHEEPLSCLCYSADARLLAAAEQRGSIVIWELASGQQVYRLAGHPAAVNSITFTPDGRRLVTGSDDTTALIWSLDPADAVVDGVSALNRTGLAELWTDLASSDASRAYRAGWRLSDQSASVAFLRERLKPAALTDREHFRKLIASLDDGQFAVREQATRELEERGDEVDSLLRQAAADSLSAEVKRRLDNLMAKAARGSPPGILRDRRAIGVLERIGTLEARDLLEMLARGAPDASKTRDAQTALARFAHIASRRETPPK